jgi:hypothetical protein
MHQSDNLCLIYYHLCYDDISNVTYLKSDTTMTFALLSLFDLYLEDGSAPGVFGYLTNTTRQGIRQIQAHLRGEARGNIQETAYLRQLSSTR